MTVFEAVMRLAARPIESRAEVFDVEVELFGADAWPEAACAAVAWAGMLEDAETDEDLNEGLQHFQSLHSIEVVSTEQWRKEIARVIQDVGSELERTGQLDAAEADVA